MTSQTMLSALFGYNQAINARLWSIITEHLTDAQFVEEIAYSRGSLRNQLVHMADAQRYWLRGLLSVPNIPALVYDDYPTREAARAICQQADQECVEVVGGLTEVDLERIPDGWSQPVWVGLMQLVHHSTDHRAQILRALHDMGAPTFDQNFAIYMENVTPMPVEALVERISTRRAQWVAAMQQALAQAATGPVRDAIAVLTWKERQVATIIHSRTVTEASFSTLPEAEQARILEAARALPLDDLLNEHHTAHYAMLAAVRTLTDAELNASAGIPGLPRDEQFWKAIAAATWWSYPLFIKDLDSA